RVQGRPARDPRAAPRGGSTARRQVRPQGVPRRRARRRRGDAAGARRARARVDREDQVGLRRALPGHGAEGTGLARALGPWAAASLVVGTIIGTGVFLKTAVMAQYGGSALWVLVAWVVAGVLSLAGALTYAELGAMFPQAGGEYVFLREGWGRA